jgi:hypothetical protein
VVFIKDRIGNTVLHAAVQHDSPLTAIRHLTILYPEAVSFSNGHGQTPLQVVQQRTSTHSLEVVDFLQSHAEATLAPPPVMAELQAESKPVFTPDQASLTILQQSSKTVRASLQEVPEIEPIELPRCEVEYMREGQVDTKNLQGEGKRLVAAAQADLMSLQQDRREATRGDIGSFPVGVSDMNRMQFLFARSLFGDVRSFPYTGIPAMNQTQLQYARSALFHHPCYGMSAKY